MSEGLPLRGRDHSGPVTVQPTNARPNTTGAVHQYLRTFETGRLLFTLFLLLRNSRPLIESFHRVPKLWFATISILNGRDADEDPEEYGDGRVRLRAGTDPRLPREKKEKGNPPNSPTPQRSSDYRDRRNAPSYVPRHASLGQ